MVKRKSDINRSKYRNTDMPDDYVRRRTRLDYVHSGMGVENDREFKCFGDFEFELSDTNDCIIIEETDHSTDIIPVEIDEEVQEKRRKEKSIEHSSDDDDVILVNIDKEVIPVVDIDEVYIKRIEDSSDYDSSADGSSADDDEDILPVYKKRKKENRKDYYTDDDAVIPVYITEKVHEKRREEKRIERKLTVDTPSNCNSQSSHKLVRRSPWPERNSPDTNVLQSSHKLVRSSPSPERNPPNTNVLLESQESQHMLGYFRCEICKITMNSECNYNNHVLGRKHLRNLKEKNLSESIVENMPAVALSENKCRYPKPPPGVIRKRVPKRSQIQDVIETTVKKPCPGLNFVVEIQGLEGVQYYCSMCEIACNAHAILPHLTGYNHQLHSVEKFKPGIYQMIHLKPKYKIQNKIMDILQGIQNKDGMGRMAVEVEELAETTDMLFDRNQPTTSKNCRSQHNTSVKYSNLSSTSRETSLASIGESFWEKYNKASIPHQSGSDFYCEICDSHMNSQLSWDAHTRGKRHITNLKKLPGDLPSKNKTVPVNRKPYIYTLIKYECPFEPIVGLSQIKETLISKPACYSYNCYLCGGTFTHHDIIEHLISFKHRTKYLDYIKFDYKGMIADRSQNGAIKLIHQICINIEKQRGPGEPAVHISKSVVYH